VVGYAVRKVRTHVFDTEPIKEKLTQLVDSRQQRFVVLANRGISHLLEEAGILIADHGYTRGRGDHNRFRIAVKLDKTLGLGEGFAAEAGIGVHLSAAGLFGVEIEFNTKPLKEGDHSAPCLRKQGVVIASDKERCAHLWYRCLKLNRSKRIPMKHSLSIGV
jgi:hypothetical protein